MSEASTGREGTGQQGPAPLPDGLSRGTLLRWVGWFGLLNGGLFALVGTRYLFAYTWSDDLLANLYIALTTLSQFALLGTLPLFLLALPLVLVFPKRRLISALGILYGALGLTLMVLDTQIFEQYRYHMSALTVAIFETSTWVLAAVTFLSVLGFEFMLAGIVWRKVIADKSGRPGVWIAMLLVFSWLTSQSIHIWADATSYVPVTQFTRVLPLYYPMKAKRRLVSLGLMDEAEMERLRELNQARIPEAGQLNYPLSPMICPEGQALPNILMIVVDAMRRDYLSESLTPAMKSFAADSQDFQNHYSGGNSSRMGYFSMFYGLPSTYWQAFYASQQAPVLMDVILGNGYQTMLSSSVGFGSPSQIDRTVFAGVPGQKSGTEGDNDTELNQAVTADWLNFVNLNFVNKGRSSSPFFGFLYYDPGSDWPAPDGKDESSLNEAERKRAGYKRGLSFIDNEIARVLESLDKDGLAENTIVILASDHGYEFDELGLGYIGHASNFSRYQLVSTLLMRWPGRNPEVFTHRSAHQDLPGTLLQEVFRCENPVADYASGGNLFDRNDWDWIIAGSYNAHAIVEPDKTVVTYPGGLMEVLGEDYKPRKGLSVDGDVAQDVMQEMRRFYR